MTWLIEQDQMGELEQRRDYIRAFVQPLLGGIKNRLCIKFLDQHPNKLHKSKTFTKQLVMFY